MSTQSMTHERFEQIRADHAEISDLVATLYRILAERNAPTSRVSSLLESLLIRIEGHFKDEEACGLFSDLKRRCPEQADAIETLEREHGELRDRIEQLCSQAAEGNLTPSRWDALELGFREFGTFLCRHESRENGMLLDAYENDLGNQD